MSSTRYVARSSKNMNFLVDFYHYLDWHLHWYHGQDLLEILLNCRARWLYPLQCWSLWVIWWTDSRTNTLTWLFKSTWQPCLYSAHCKFFLSKEKLDNIISSFQFHWNQSDTPKHLLHQDDRFVDDLYHDLSLLWNLPCVAERSLQEKHCLRTRLEKNQSSDFLILSLIQRVITVNPRNHICFNI